MQVGLTADARLCHDDGDGPHLEWPTAYVIRGEPCGLTGPWATREEAQAEADAENEDFGCGPHEVEPVYGGWYVPESRLDTRGATLGG